MVLIGSLMTLNHEINTMIGGGNYEFIINSLNWLHERPATTWIPPFNVAGAVPTVMDTAQQHALAVTAIGGIPLLCVIIGVFVWYKRRYS
jgi:hypothetical protein